MPERKGLETLKELRQMKAHIDQAISALEEVYGAKSESHSEWNSQVVNEIHDYSRMSLRAGALAAVLGAREPQSTKNVVDLLIAGGLRSKSKSIGRTVYTTLYGLAKAPDSKIEMAGDGKWVKK